MKDLQYYYQVRKILDKLIKYILKEDDKVSLKTWSEVDVETTARISRAYAEEEQARQEEDAKQETL